MYLFVEFTYEAHWQSFFNNLHKLLDFLSAPVVGAVTLQLADKDNWDVFGLSAIDPRPDCGWTSVLSARLLPHCPDWAWLKQALPSKDSCWLASANGGVTSSSPGEGRTALQTIVLPRISSSSSSSSGSSGSGSRGRAASAVVWSDFDFF